MWRDELRTQGYSARRGQQFSGSPDSPDVVCDALPWLHFEVKCVERLNIEDAMDQARRDAGQMLKAETLKAEIDRIPIVAHKRNHRRWLVTMEAETFFRLLRGDFVEPQRRRGAEIGVEPQRHEEHQVSQSLVTSTPTKDGSRGATSPTSESRAAARAADTGGKAEKLKAETLKYESGSLGTACPTNKVDSLAPARSALGAPSPDGEFLSPVPNRLKSENQDNKPMGRNPNT